MNENSQDKNQKLSSAEYERVDELLASARKFHYLSFILAGLSLLFSSIEEFGSFSLPLGDVVIPKTQTAVGIYIIVILMNMAAFRLFMMAFPFLKVDKRRPPFAWIAMGSCGSSQRLIIIWLMIPVVISAVAAAITVIGDITGLGLCFAGLFTILLPRTISEHINLINNRRDHRGGPSTYSMHLLYVYRLSRQILVTIWLFIPILAIIPKWRNSLLPFITISVIAIAPIFVLRIICGIPFVYKRIDKYGTKFGFPEKSEHY
jgi:hypothetical protein